MRSVILPLLLAILVLPGSRMFGQETNDHSHQEAEASESFRHHRLALLLAHTHVSTRNRKEGLLIPTYGLDYEYWFNKRWALGLHTDLELQTFIVQTEHEEELERDYPLVVTLDLLWRPWKGLVFELGPGYEFEKNEDLFLIRMGVSYEIELPHHWDLAPTFFYDSRFESFDTYTLGLVIGRRF